MSGDVALTGAFWRGLLALYLSRDSDVGPGVLFIAVGGNAQAFVRELSYFSRINVSILFSSAIHCFRLRKLRRVQLCAFLKQL